MFVGYFGIFGGAVCGGFAGCLGLFGVLVWFLGFIAWFGFWFCGIYRLCGFGLLCSGFLVEGLVVYFDVLFLRLVWLVGGV